MCIRDRYKLVGEGYEAKALTLVGSVTLYVEGALSVSTLIGRSGATIVLDQKGSCLLYTSRCV